MSSEEIDEFNIHHESVRVELRTKKEKQNTVNTTQPRKRINPDDPTFKMMMEQLKYNQSLTKPTLGICRAEKVMEEVEYLTGDVLFMHYCGDAVKRFYEGTPHQKGNVMLIKDLQVHFEDLNLELTPTLYDIVSEVARKELELGKGAKSLENFNTKSYLYVLMLNFIYSGDTLANAASRAAERGRQIFPERSPPKASSLIKGYEQAFCKKRIDRFGFERPSEEQMYFGIWDKTQSQERKDQWKQILRDWPLADDDLRGVRSGTEKPTGKK